MAYKYYRRITINHLLCGGADSPNFVFSFRASDPAFRTAANGGRLKSTSGYDLAFFADQALTQLLKFEIRRWDGLTGELVAEVRVPMLTAAADTVIFLAYGDPEITNSEA